MCSPCSYQYVSARPVAFWQVISSSSSNSNFSTQAMLRPDPIIGLRDEAGKPELQGPAAHFCIEFYFDIDTPICLLSLAVVF